jgi:aldehyde:ferredoxin oxidoreductase
MPETYGWVGKILRVDLTARNVTDEDTMKYVKDFIGGRGINAKIAWDEIPPEADPFDSENRLMIMTGPLTGTATPATGKIELNTLGPQVYPKSFYTRSSMGGAWGAELKYAGYDGVIIQGKSEESVYVWVHDGEAEIKSAKRLWGADIFLTQQLIMKEHGPKVKSIAIGPAGEHLVRFATVANETSNAAGQGGFGAVMGSKKLKAVAAKGTGSIKVANIDKFLEVRKHILDLLPERHLTPIGHKGIAGGFLGERLTALSEYEWRYTSCSGCIGLCQGKIVLKVPGRLHSCLNTGHIHCMEQRWMIPGWNIPSPGYKSSHVGLPEKMPKITDYESSFEVKIMGDKYGINMWEFTIGIIPWLVLCMNAGFITKEDLEISLPLDRGEFWSMLLRKIAYREGIGDTLAEGVRRATDILGKGKEYLPHVAHGYAEQDIGRGVQSAIKFPHWVCAALMWAVDSRGSFASTPESHLPLSDRMMKRISKRLYGTEKAIKHSYEGKAVQAIWHQNRQCISDSLVSCVHPVPMLPTILSPRTSDGLGDTAIESMLLSAVTGTETSEKELDKAGERIFNLERAVMARQGRTREYDVGCGVIEYMKERPDTNGIRLDEEKFLKLLDEFYTLRGWDVKTGVPTIEKLQQLNLKYVVDDLNKRALLP